MKYPTKLKSETRFLRKSGLSLGQIQQQMKIPKTTIREWISDIVLTPSQQEILKERMVKSLREGRVKANQQQQEKKILLEKKLFHEGLKEIKSLTKQERFIAGVALYWAEGFKNKHEHRLGFCNSDPQMILFYISWLQHCLNIPKEKLTTRVTINIAHKDREKEIQSYWSSITGIPANHFTKTFYQNTAWKKQFNSNDYYGVLRIHVKESMEQLNKMKGWIEGLKQSF